MKKIMSIGVVFCLVFSVILSTCALTFALNDVSLSVGGEVSKVQYSQVNNDEVIYIYSNSTQIIRQYIIAPEGSITYYRLIFEISGTSVPRTIYFDVNKGSVRQIRIANLSDPKRANVVVDVNKKPDYTLVPSQDGKALVLTIKGASNGNVTPSPTPAPVPTSTPTSTTKPTSTPVPSQSATPSPKPSGTPVPSTPTPSNNSGAGGTITRNGPVSWTMSGDTCVVTLEGITLSQSPSTSHPYIENRISAKILQITIPGNDTRFSKGFLSGNNIIKGVLINYNDKNNQTIIRISYHNAVTYTLSVSNGNSIIKIKEGSSTTPQPSATPAPTPSTKPSATPSPSVTPTPTPSTSPSRGIPDTMKNIQLGDGTNTAVKIVDKDIVTRYRQLSGSVVTDTDEDENTFTFMFPINIVNLGSGIADADAGVLKSVVAYSTSKNSYLMLTSKSSGVSFKIVEGSNSDELLIVPETNQPLPVSSKLVVLDPGHGGSDPGGVVGSYLEKDYNLDISLRVYNILKSKGVKVEITRTTDVFVALNDRADFANNKNADLFVSIHNNIMPSSYKGSMVLYYPTSYKGKAYAQIIQNNLVKDLGTGNIGIDDRGDLVVLKRTKMPAVLIEVACMSHPDDMALLNTESFRQKAAESIANSIIQIINSM